MIVTRTGFAVMVIAIVFDLVFAGMVYWAYRQAKADPSALTINPMVTRRLRFRASLLIWIGYTIYIAFITWNYLSRAQYWMI